MPRPGNETQGGCECCVAFRQALQRPRSRRKIADIVRGRLSSENVSGKWSYSMLLVAQDPSRKLDASYTTIERIGSGAFGCVWKAKSRASGELFAIKGVSLARKKSEKQFLEAELEAMLRLDHPNIVKLVEYFETSKHLWMVTELCCEGDFSKLTRRTHSVDEIRNLYEHICHAVAYCHQCCIIHRDLKFDNCLLTMSPRGTLVGKVIDFGLSAIRACNVVRPGGGLHDVLGTKYFIAPEVLDTNNDYNEKCDCWALGVMLYITFTDEHPFVSGKQKNDTNLLFARILSSHVRACPLQNARIEKSLTDLIYGLLVKQSKRLSAAEICEHPWLNSGPTDLKAYPSGSLILDDKKLKHIIGFGEASCFEKALLTILAHQQHSDTVEQLGKVFEEIDTSKTGSLSKDEIADGLIACGQKLSEEQLETIFSSLDSDGNGKVQYTDWLAATLDSSVAASAAANRQAFDFLDIDKSGVVSLSNLIRVLGDEAAARDALKMADIDCSGAITWDNFNTFMEAFVSRMNRWEA